MPHLLNTILFISITGIMATSAYQHRNTICSTASMSCVHPNFIHISEIAAAEFEYPEEAQSHVFTNIMRNCSLTLYCQVWTREYCTNVTYYCAQKDKIYVELPTSHDQFSNFTTKDYKLALQTKGYGEGIYQSAINTKCQLNVQGSVDENMSLLLALVDLGPYMDFPTANFCLSIRGKGFSKFCTGDGMPKKPAIRHQTTYMKYQKSNNQWVLDFNWEWEGTGITEQMKIQTQIGFVVYFSVCNRWHTFATEPWKHVTCQTEPLEITSTAVLLESTTSNITEEYIGASVTQATAIKLGFNIALGGLIAAGAFLLIVVFVMAFAAVSCIFNRFFPRKGTECATSNSLQDENTNVYEEVQEVPEVPQSSRPSLNSLDLIGHPQGPESFASPICKIHGNLGRRLERQTLCHDDSRATTMERFPETTTDRLDVMEELRGYFGMETEAPYKDMTGKRGFKADRAPEVEYTEMNMRDQHPLPVDYMNYQHPAGEKVFTVPRRPDGALWHEEDGYMGMSDHM